MTGGSGESSGVVVGNGWERWGRQAIAKNSERPYRTKNASSVVTTW